MKHQDQKPAKGITLGYIFGNSVKIALVIAGGLGVGVINMASQLAVGKEVISDKAVDKFVGMI